MPLHLLSGVTHVHIKHRLAQEYTSLLPSTAAVLLWLTVGHKMCAFDGTAPSKKVAASHLDSHVQHS